ncbi:predicted protein [Lichtheimia corymbifera JMRC:FSU:9682]|uniref:Uncharacterized protein n=1 Tax=Lichtheimia corymbifera JMRC:FSU:9682 TaxID=1263082 RepID=A0A068S2M4_9FUNG|nr:predicted protein [Lichtheimia corymbifera JMRC:FSU:9682]
MSILFRLNDNSDNGHKKWGAIAINLFWLRALGDDQRIVVADMVDLLGNIVFSGFLLITAGASLALQAGCNSNLARHAGRTFAPFWSFGSGLICCLIFFIIDTQALKTPLPDQSLLDAPGYVWIGGLMGAYYVFANLVSMPRLGAATSLSIFVCSQKLHE